MTFALEYIPENVHIVIFTRNDPPLPLSRWWVRRQLKELRSQDLRFTRTEAESFLNYSSKLKLSRGHSWGQQPWVCDGSSLP